MRRRDAFLHRLPIGVPMLAHTIDSRGKHRMNPPARNERIAIEGMIECCNAAGERWRVLRWRRQVDAGEAGEPVRWESIGPAVFTLLDASAVIQISGSALQIVANGMVLNVVDHLDVMQNQADDAPAVPGSQPAGARAAELDAAVA